eukprot:6706472-Prymnesium_polylepis.3
MISCHLHRTVADRSAQSTDPMPSTSGGRRGVRRQEKHLHEGFATGWTTGLLRSQSPPRSACTRSQGLCAAPAGSWPC